MMEGVFVDNFLGNNVKLKFHIFGILEVIIQVEMFYVSDEAFSSRCRNYAFEPGMLSTPTATVTTAKFLFNSVISTPGDKCL